MGFIESYIDIMNMETAMLKYMFELFLEDYWKEIELLKANIPKIEFMPAIKFREAKETISTGFTVERSPISMTLNLKRNS